MGGPLCGISLTLVLIAWAVSGFIKALQEERKGKAVVLGVVIAPLMLLCCSGGYLGVSGGIGYETGPAEDFGPAATATARAITGRVTSARGDHGSDGW
jgi:hypothetical protein